jgi:hypothetical protein
MICDCSLAGTKDCNYCLAAKSSIEVPRVEYRPSIILPPQGDRIVIQVSSNWKEIVSKMIESQNDR